MTKLLRNNMRAQEHLMSTLLSALLFALLMFIRYVDERFYTLALEWLAYTSIGCFFYASLGLAAALSNTTELEQHSANKSPQT